MKRVDTNKGIMQKRTNNLRIEKTNRNTGMKENKNWEQKELQAGRKAKHQKVK